LFSTIELKHSVAGNVKVLLHKVIKKCCCILRELC